MLSAPEHGRKDPTVLAIVLTWNSSAFVRDCIESLRGSSYPARIMVVDNHSQDDTRQIITQEYPEVDLVDTGDNLGYAGGNNVGLLVAQEQGYDYCFILNPDAGVEPDCIAKLVEIAERDRSIGGVNPSIVLKGTDQLWFAGSIVNLANGDSASQHPYEERIEAARGREFFPTDRLCGGALLLRTTALADVGLLGEDYFLYYEDTDWSMRARRNGLKLLVSTEAVAWHQPSSSGKSTPTVYWYYMARNRLLFLSKNASLSWRTRARVLRSLTISFLVTVKSDPRHGWPFLHATVRGWRDYGAGRFGARP